MQTDPVEEWRRLTTLYSEMGDVEIQELAEQIKDLTPNAQGILRDELKKRGMSEVLEPKVAGVRIPRNIAFDDADQQMMNTSVEADYSWYVTAFETENREEAYQFAEILRRAGIDRSVRGGPSEMYRIEVAADQVDEAKSILEQPIPQDVVEQVKAEIAQPEYKLPLCPKCRGEEIVLESVEPSNHWMCESCGYTWSDPVGDASASAQPAG